MNTQQWFDTIRQSGQGGMVRWAAEQLAAKDDLIVDLQRAIETQNHAASLREDRVRDGLRAIDTQAKKIVAQQETINFKHGQLIEGERVIAKLGEQIRSQVRQIEGLDRRVTDQQNSLKQAIDNKQLVIDANARQFKIIEQLRKQLESHGIYPAHLAGLDETLAQKGVTDECVNRAANAIFSELFADKPTFHVHSGFDFGRGESWSRRWWLRGDEVLDEVISPARVYRSDCGSGETSDSESVAEAEARETESLAHKVETLWREHTCGPDATMVYRDLNGKIAAGNKLQSDRFFSLSKQADVHDAQIRHASKSRGKMHGQIDAIIERSNGHDLSIQQGFAQIVELAQRTDQHRDVGDRLIVACVGESRELPTVPLIEQIAHLRTDIGAAVQRVESIRSAVIPEGLNYGGDPLTERMQRLDIWKKNVLDRIESLERHRAGGTVG